MIRRASWGEEDPATSQEFKDSPEVFRRIHLGRYIVSCPAYILLTSTLYLRSLYRNDQAEPYVSWRRDNAHLRLGEGS
jgi:hypothetical protein